MRIARSSYRKWSFAIDRGGTFTDIIGVDADGHIHSDKLLSESTRYSDPAIEGIRRMLNISPGAPIPDTLVAGIRMGTTVATNALLERKGASVALFTTRGFRDLLEIGYQNRPQLFALAIRKPEQIYRCVKEVDERIDEAGKVIRPLDLERTAADLRRIRRMGVSSVAIVLMHSWKNGSHEEKVAKMARDTGFRHVSASHEIMPLIKIVGRGQTTVVDAYLSPILVRYIESIRKSTGNIPLEFMQSSGGITDAALFTGKDAIISGPAGGVIGSAAVAKINSIAESVGFDMGGTSTDVSRFDGTFEKVYEVTTGGIQFQASSLNVNTVAAGGGSLLWFDGQKLRVGPESAGADPGPACYGHGGPLALTDANLLLGRLLPSYFPKTFGPSHDRPLDRKIVQELFRDMASEVNEKLSTHLSPVQVALGFVRIANETMAKAIKEISVSRGYDVRTHALICFGGASPQHACSIARILGMRRIVIHPLVGLLSAYGIAMADRLRYAVRSVVRKLDGNVYDSLGSQFDELTRPLMNELLDTHGQTEKIETHFFLDVRPLGADTALSIPVADLSPRFLKETVSKTFFKKYQRHFGFEPSGVPLELVNIRVEVVGKGHVFQETRIKNQDKRTRIRDKRARVEPRETVEVYFEGGSTPTPVYHREDLTSEYRINGPAIVVEDFSTTVIEPGFSASLTSYGHLIMTGTDARVETVSPRRDPVMLEVFNHLFMSVAEQMGYTLANTAHSTNIKERLDFSCAIFDRLGNLIANAPHIPVHLGAMGESVKSIVRDNEGSMSPGDVYVMNNPHRGGSHLPDVTVIAPVFPAAPPGTRGKEGSPAQGETPLDGSGKTGESPVFYAASRGHHADMGGITPGSMPPFASTLQEEGVVIDNFLLVRNGKFKERELRNLLLSGPYPARNIEERISDLEAQIAAINRGVRELQRLVDKYGLKVVHAYMKHIRDNAAETMRDSLCTFLKGRSRFESHFEDFLDDGARIAVTVTIEQGGDPPRTCRAVADFSDTSPELPGNLNAPIAVTKAAVLYVFRTLIDEDIPLNSGCLIPIALRIPRGCLLNPSPQAAVVGGNVETSQRVVDALLGALRLSGASQGTMNNFLFGRDDGKGRQYYETVAGGSGAVDGHPGASAVQVHMTNTRMTDPEVLEQRYPEIRLERFALRRGSGGRGKYRGGDGAIRELRFLKQRRISILSERRRFSPYGMAGGEAGARGKNVLIMADGTRKNLGGKAELLVQKGDRIIIKTPGGGGFGKWRNKNPRT